MKQRTKVGFEGLSLVIVVAVLGVSAGGQVVNSGARPIALQAVLNDSLTVTLSANAVNFNLTYGSANNPGSTGILAITTWNLKSNVNSVNLYAFFASSAVALTDGTGNNIPSSSFQISDNAGPFTPLTNTVPFGGANAGLQLSSTLILGNNKNGVRADIMNFNINLAPLTNLPAATYTGVLTLQAQAI